MVLLNSKIRAVATIILEFLLGVSILFIIIFLLFLIAMYPIAMLYVGAVLSGLILSWLIGFALLANIKEKISQRKEKKNA